VAACPSLVELTLRFPFIISAKTGTLYDAIATMLSGASKLVNTCKVLPSFDTLQIVHYHPDIVGLDCLTKAKTPYLEGERRRKTTLRVIKFSSDHKLGPLKVEEYEM